MIVLSGTAPTNAGELVGALQAILSRAVAVRGSGVAAEGVWPNLSTLTIDLTGATPLERPAGEWASGDGAAVAGFSTSAFRIVGRPFGTAERAIDLDVSARDCRAEFVDVGSRAALRLAGAKDGKLRASVTRAAVEQVVRVEAGKMARAQGVDIKEVQIAWQQRGPRGLSVEAVVKAKKGFLPAATVRVRGTLEIDGSLTARLSGLSVEGEGIVGGMAAGLIRPKLAKAEGMSRSLVAVPLDALRVTDVRLSAESDRLTVEGDFAG